MRALIERLTALVANLANNENYEVHVIDTSYYRSTHQGIASAGGMQGHDNFHIRACNKSEAEVRAL